MNSELLDTYPKYDSYQDSGVDWLGEIPADWQLLKVRNVFRLSNKFAEKNNSHELLSVYTDIGVKPRRELEARGNKASTTDGYLIVEKGDIVVNKLLAWMGAIGYSNYDGVTSPAYDILKPIRPVSSMFYHFLFRTPRCVSELKRNSRGIMDMRLRLYFDKFGNVLVPYPSLAEQEKIISFLNNETAKIDQAITLKQQQIETLNEYKQIIIQSAVTKGLNPDAKMKDSGIHWMGDIPEHWDCTAIKRLLSIPITDGPHTTPEFYDEGIPFISAESIKNGVINFDKKRGYISILDYEKYSKKYQPKKNDIYMVKSGATTGRVAMVEVDKVFTIWSPLAVFRTKQNILLPKFLYIYLQSKSLQKGIELSWTFGTQQNIGMGVLGNLHCVVPTLEEQDKIIIYLDSVLTKVDATRDSCLAQIERLKEYKTILINQAVTGKIKVS